MRCWRCLIFLFAVVLLIAPADIARGQETSPPAPHLDFPYNGAALQGTIQVTVSGEMPENHGAVLTFAYANHSQPTWFILWETSDPVQTGELATWDTTTITDGTYDLRLVIQTTSGEQIEKLVQGVRVRNYTPVETDTPAPTRTPVPGLTPSPTPRLTATATALPVAPLPNRANPASLESSQLLQVVTYAVAGVLGIFIVLGLYLYLRKTLRNRA
jgi:hypothetical protein